MRRFNQYIHSESLLALKMKNDNTFQCFPHIDFNWAGHTGISTVTKVYFTISNNDSLCDVHIGLFCHNINMNFTCWSGLKHSSDLIVIFFSQVWLSQMIEIIKLFKIHNIRDCILYVMDCGGDVQSNRTLTC